MNGLAGCYVSTIGKPHEYSDLTTSNPKHLLTWKGQPTAHRARRCARTWNEHALMHYALHRLVAVSQSREMSSTAKTVKKAAR